MRDGWPALAAVLQGPDTKRHSLNVRQWRMTRPLQAQGSGKSHEIKSEYLTKSLENTWWSQKVIKIWRDIYELYLISYLQLSFVNNKGGRKRQWLQQSSPANKSNLATNTP